MSQRVPGERITADTVFILPLLTTVVFTYETWRGWEQQSKNVWQRAENQMFSRKAVNRG